MQQREGNNWKIKNKIEWDGLTFMHNYPFSCILFNLKSIKSLLLLYFKLCIFLYFCPKLSNFSVISTWEHIVKQSCFPLNLILADIWLFKGWHISVVNNTVRLDLQKVEVLKESLPLPALLLIRWAKEEILTISLKKRLARSGITWINLSTEVRGTMGERSNCKDFFFLFAKCGFYFSL